MLYINDYKSYKEANKKFFDVLSTNNSMVFDRFSDILKVLGYIELMHDTNRVDEDLETIFETGYFYLYGQMETVKLFYHNYFNSNYEEFSKYEVLINYYLYLEDLLDTLSDDGKLINKNVKEGIDKIIKKIDTILMEHLTYSDKMLEDINCEINSLSIKNTPLTTQEVFGMIAEERDL